MKRTFNDWDGDTPEEIAQAFEVRWPEGAELLFADYTYENYSGNAQVIYRDAQGALYEINATHCSCNGLERQWSPEPVEYKELLERARRRVNRERFPWDDPVTDAERALLFILETLEGGDATE